MLREPTPLADEQLRQYVNASTAFEALLDAERAAEQVRGGMLWKTVDGKRYLVRTSSAGAQRGMGVETAETRAIYESFTERKTMALSRLRSLRQTVATQQRINKALRIGHAPSIVTSILEGVRNSMLADHFLVAGTHALYAYEAASGMRLDMGYLATNDIDLFYDAQKHMRFLSTLEMKKTSLLSIFRGVDRTFKIRDDQKYTAVNATGFEIDVIRRPARNGDPHPMPIAAGEPDEDTFWAVQVSSGDRIGSSGRFRQIVVAANGAMARMETIDPASFVRIKRSLSLSPNRDRPKAIKDGHQADLVQWMLDAGHLVPQSRLSAEPVPSGEISVPPRFRG